MKIGEVEITEDDYKIGLQVVNSFWSFRLPKNRKGRVGIVIAINTEKQREKILLQNELIKNIKKSLEDQRLNGVFELIELSQNHSKKITNKIKAEYYLKKTKGNLLIYGSISERKIHGKSHFYFDLAGRVNHSPVPPEVSRKLSEEFTELMPMKITFPTDDELLGFNITQEWLGHTSKYIVGISLILSSRIDLAEKIFTDLEKDLSQLSSSIPAVGEIKKRIPLRLIDIALGRINVLYKRHIRYKKETDMELIKKQIDIIDKYKYKSYTANLMKSIYQFLINRDIKAAIHTLYLVKGGHDMTWRLNLAFLYAYDGKLSDAMKQYDKALNQGNLEGQVVIDTEIFILDILKKEPERYTLLFLNGYLNWKIKKDKKLAVRDFREFIKVADITKYQNEIALANQLIQSE